MRKIRIPLTLALLGLAGTLLPVSAFAAAPTGASDIGDIDQASLAKVLPGKPPCSPYRGRAFPTRPLFGDTHVHTSYSLDAGAAGARLGPVEALRFGKGEEVMASSGQPAAGGLCGRGQRAFHCDLRPGRRKDGGRKGPPLPWHRQGVISAARYTR